MSRTKIPKNYKGPKVVKGDMKKLMAFFRKEKAKQREEDIDDNLEQKLRSFGVID